MERRSFATLILTTVCFAACDSNSAPPEKPQPPSPSAEPAPQTQPAPQTSPAPAAEQPAPSPAPATKQPPPAAQQTKPQPPRGGRSDESVRSFSVYALSRGTGVPAAAREAQQKVQELLEFDRGRGVVMNVQTTRIGIEGERRLCVTYADSKEFARALKTVRAMVKGVDLINVVVEPCAPSPGESPTKEKP